MGKKLIGIGLLVLGAVLLVTTVSSFLNRGGAGMEVDRVVEDLSQDAELHLESTSVDWRIEPTSSQQLFVEIEGQKNNQKLTVSERGNRLVVKIEEGNTISLPFLHFGPDTEAVAHVPVNMLDSFHVKTVSGDVEFAASFFGDQFSFKSVSGDIVANGLEFDQANFETTSGDIQVDNFNGGIARNKTVSGDIELEHVSGEVIADTVSGDILVTYKDENKDVNVKTVSGDIELEIPSLNATLDLRTTSGNMTVEEMLTDQHFEKRKASGTAGDGNFKISSNTVSGDIEIRK
ncbi:DUF4097 family beta strand repeat-containing protein [Bacillus sp. FJAT-45037]|uniref:DUF4097 family beta strand repeat-containing protein n=1 Tax=Bacillus sp. FJAT-45037 TaxID=2011007 RepID=UPI000C231811|nr:DUF4097 family beta strand repeat-containing protein [Bacillus sp. FJAT-45037]